MIPVITPTFFIQFEKQVCLNVCISACLSVSHSLPIHSVSAPIQNSLQHTTTVYKYTGRSRLDKGTSHGEVRSREETLVCASKSIALCEVSASAIRDCFEKKRAGWPLQKWGRTGRYQEEQRVSAPSSIYVPKSQLQRAGRTLND